MESISTVAFVDPDAEAVRVVQRLGPSSWRDDRFSTSADIDLPSLGITVPKEEIFARD